MLSDGDLQAIWLTVRLAGIVTVILLLVGTPIAWWLAHTPSRKRNGKFPNVSRT